ncbi:hypothetical protein ACVWWI_006530 [Bradyrhizobium sp. USDA 3686]|nr:hypothetical protein [Bradyrhizobium canariense]
MFRRNGVGSSARLRDLRSLYQSLIEQNGREAVRGVFCAIGYIRISVRSLMLMVISMSRALTPADDIEFIRAPCAMFWSLMKNDSL